MSILAMDITADPTPMPMMTLVGTETSPVRKEIKS
jgi:hypothetical protein